MKFKRKTKKIIVIGCENIGKTSLAYRFMYNCFPMQNQDYFLDDVYSRIIVHKKQNIEINTIDYPSLNNESFINVQLFQADAFIFMYSITDRESFLQIQMIRQNIIKSTGKTIPSILIGNKSDLKNQRQVLKREGKLIAQLWNSKFHEISIKDCEIENIEIIYKDLLKTIDNFENPQYVKLKQYKIAIKQFIIKNGNYIQKFFTVLNIFNTIIGLFFLFSGIIFTLLKTISYENSESMLFLFIIIGVTQLIIFFIAWFSTTYSKEIIKIYYVLSLIQIIIESIDLFLIKESRKKYQDQCQGSYPQKEGLVDLWPLLQTQLNIIIIFTIILMIMIKYYFKEQKKNNFIQKNKLDQYL